MRKVGIALFMLVWVVGVAQATPGNGFSGVTLASGKFEDIDVNHLFSPNELNAPGVFTSPNTPPKLPWHSIQMAAGESDLYIQSNTWVAGGHTGWHSHPGHSLIIITSGTVTVYHGDDPACEPHTYSAPATIVDYGGNEVHMIRNETSNPVIGFAVQLIPHGANRRLDRPANPACGF
jgi:hypothetical protein